MGTRTGYLIDGRYRLDEPIASGGIGQVWQATDLLLERPVAVKLLRPEHAGHPATRARFRTEARHAGALSHPCVAQVYDYGHAGPGGPPYLVMELVNGPSLADLLAVDAVPPAFALDVVAQAARGLQAAHRIGLVHRDVKPANILIAAEGRVKITDFGIAHAAGQTPLTQPGLVMGTTQYLAPERIGGQAGTPASDLYALGIVLHECLTGVPPYDGTPAEVMTAHLHAPLPPLPARLPSGLAVLVGRLTAKDPATRLSDAGQLAALALALRDELTGTPGPGQQPAGPRRRESLAGSGRGALAVAAGTALLAGAGIAGVLAAGPLGAGPATGRMTARPGAPLGARVRPLPPSAAATAIGSAAGPVPPQTAAGSGSPPGRPRHPARSPARGTPASSATAASPRPTPRPVPSPGGPATPTPVPTVTGGGGSTPPASAAPPSTIPPPAPSPTSPTASPSPPWPIPLPVPLPTFLLRLAGDYDR